MQFIIEDIYVLFNSKYGDLIFLINAMHNYENFKQVYNKLRNNENITIMEKLSYKHIFDKIENIIEFGEVLDKYEKIRFNDEINNIETEAYDIFRFLKYKMNIFNNHDGTSNNIIYNVLKNSYNPWKFKYSDDIIHKRTDNVIEYLINNKYIYKLNNKLTLKNIENDKDDKYEIKEDNTLKRNLDKLLYDGRYNSKSNNNNKIISDIYNNSQYNTTKTHDILCKYNRRCQCFSHSYCSKLKCPCILCPYKSNKEDLIYMKDKIKSMVYAHHKKNMYANIFSHTKNNKHCYIKECSYHK